MEPPQPLDEEAFEAIFLAEPGDYPGFVGHTTLELSPKDEQPPSVVSGQVDGGIRVTEEQAAAFVRDGVVVIEDLIGEAQLEAWREQFWGVIGASPDDASTWPGARWEGTVWQQNARGPCVHCLRPSVGHLPQVRAVVEQLGGATQAEGQRPKMPGRPQEPMEHAVLQWPPGTDTSLSGSELARSRARASENPGREWALPRGGHVDASNPQKGGWVGGCTIVAATYLHDVGPRGGGT